MGQKMSIQPQFLYNDIGDEKPTPANDELFYRTESDMNKRKNAKFERVYKMEYNTDPIDYMVDDIKGSADVLAKVIFAGFNIVFLVILGVILVTNFGM